jgi:hypothetical protein
MIETYIDLVALDPATDAHHARVRGRAWPRLWTWIGFAHPELLDHETIGRGLRPVDNPVRLDAETTRRIADALAADLSTGEIDEAIRAMLDHYASLDLVDCSTCEGTGIRTDEIGRLLDLPSIVLDETRRIALGRDVGTCDVCDGLGRHEHEDTLFTFERETVEGFTSFLRSCGGLVIL